MTMPALSILDRLKDADLASRSVFIRRIQAAILHLTRMMAKYLAKDHIAVNAIAPGYFPSKMTDAIAEEESEVIEGNTPMRRWGRPEDMAVVARSLASPAPARRLSSPLVAPLRPPTP